MGELKLKFSELSNKECKLVTMYKIRSSKMHGINEDGTANLYKNIHVGHWILSLNTDTSEYRKFKNIPIVDDLIVIGEDAFTGEWKKFEPEIKEEEQ